jgi:hypothetical protein
MATSRRLLFLVIAVCSILAVAADDNEEWRLWKQVE